MLAWPRNEYKSKSIIDLIVYDENSRELVKSSRMMRGSEYETKHFLVMSTVDLEKVDMERKKMQIILKL